MSPRRWTLLAGGVGVVAAVLSTWPLVGHLGHAIPVPYEECSEARCADDLLCVWIVGEGGRRLYRHPLTVFDANIFHPLRHALAYSESMLAAGALVAPVTALSGNPILGYDLYYLATAVLSVLGMFLLVREMTGDPRAALLAGWAFGLAAERWEFRGHLPSVAVQWAPFVLWSWLRLVRAPSRGRALAAVGLLVVHMQTSAYHGLMLPVLLVPWALVLILCGPWPARRWLAAAAVGAAGVCLGLLPYLPYTAVRAEMQYDVSQRVPIWSTRYVSPYLHPLAYVQQLVAGERAELHSPLPMALLAVAAVVVALRRPAATRLAGQGALLLAALVFQLSAALVSLGKQLILPGLPIVRGPFFFLAALPGFGTMRIPHRFVLLAALGGAMVTGLATATILRRLRDGRVAAAVVVLLGAVVFVDTQTLRTPMALLPLPGPAEVPPVYRWLETTPPETAVLELPYGHFFDDPLYMIYSLYHGRRLMNGYSAILPNFIEAISRFPDEPGLRMLQDAGVRYVILHPDRLAPAGLSGVVARAERRPDLRPMRKGRDVVLEIPDATESLPVAPGSALDRGGWQLTASAPGVETAADGVLDTHWTAPADRDGFVRVDLGQPTTVTGVTVRLGAHLQEYPRRYEVHASLDGSTWTQVGGEDVTLPPFASYRRDHLAIEVPLRMTPALARYLELRVPATPADLQGYLPPTWGVHELVVYGPTPGG